MIYLFINHKEYFIALFVFAFCIRCGHESTPIALSEPTLLFSVEQAAESSITVSNQGRLIYSYIEQGSINSSFLKMVFIDKGDVSQAYDIANGEDWFVNWADFPSVAVYKDNPQHLVSYYLEKSSIGTYDYDIRIVQSTDGGKSWGEPFTIHTDKTATEHGFVTLVPVDSSRIFACWLDGRNTKNEGHSNNKEENGHHQHDGTMTLRTAEFDIKGKLYNETELDKKVCDCCNTDAVMTGAGPVVVYRNRSDKEIRDIALTRKLKYGWTDPRTIHDDLWKISGCPVNGPAIDSKDETIAVAWYSIIDTVSVSQVGFSSDTGAHFNAPIVINAGSTLGRMDIVLASETEVWVSWLKDIGDGNAMITLTHLNSEIGALSHYDIQETTAARCSGFPKIKLVQDTFYLAWTDCSEKYTRANLSAFVIK